MGGKNATFIFDRDENFTDSWTNCYSGNGYSNKVYGGNHAARKTAIAVSGGGASYRIHVIPWIEWKGGPQPVDGGCFVKIRLRNGSVFIGHAGDAVWEFIDLPDPLHIVAYQIIGGAHD